jgi:hypothetical protein
VYRTRREKETITRRGVASKSEGEMGGRNGWVRETVTYTQQEEIKERERN